jgi:hypothetical protein
MIFAFCLRDPPIGFSGRHHEGRRPCRGQDRKVRPVRATCRLG